MAMNERVYAVYFFGTNEDCSPEATDDWEEHYAENWQEVADNSLRQCSDDVNRVDVYQVPANLSNFDGSDLDLHQLNYRTSATRDEE